MAGDILTPNGNGFTASGSVAQRLLNNGMNTDILRPWVGADGNFYVNQGEKAVLVGNAATLRKDEWKQYDSAILKVVQDRLVGVGDLISRGLVYNIANGLGTTVLEYEDMSDMTDANISMDGMTRGEKDRPQFDINYMPLPIIHKDFSINARVLAASRTTGQPLDTTQAEIAARKVIEKIETILFAGASAYTFGGGTIRGYLDHPNRNTYSLTANWDDSAATGSTILNDVLGMKQASINAGFFGPWMLYIPTNFETAVDGDFKAASDKSTRSRLLEIDGLTDIKVSDKLTADNVVLVQMTADTVRIVNGLGVTVVEWASDGNMVHNFKVMAIQVPQIRADQDGNCGVVHAS